MTVDDMRSYYEHHYRPGNATIVVVGDVAAEDAFREVEARFGSIEDPYADDVPRPSSPKPDLLTEVRIRTSWDDNSSRLIMAWPGAKFGTDEDFTLDIIVTVLTSGKLSRMYRRLVVEEGLATSVSANNDARAENGGFWLYAEAVAGIEPEALEAAIDQEIARLRDEPVPEAEMVRAKHLLAASEAFDSETVTDVAETLGEYAVDLTWQDALTVNDRRDSVTAEDVQRIARELLDHDRRIVAWSLPAAPSRAAAAPESEGATT
jgi:predicted Zn-dependent peptidase